MDSLELTLHQIYADPKKIMTDGKKQIAFIGRSNVGKSSLINLISKQKKVALVSSTPGKTKTINFFNVKNDFYLVDLPGYGFAKSSKVQRDEWERRTLQYFSLFQKNLVLFLLIDGRHPIQNIDKEFIQTLIELDFPRFVVLTKTDKSKQNEIAVSKNSIKEFLDHFNLSYPIIETSAETGKGRTEILKTIKSVTA